MWSMQFRIRIYMKTKEKIGRRLWGGDSSRLDLGGAFEPYPVLKAQLVHL